MPIKPTSVISTTFVVISLFFSAGAQSETMDCSRSKVSKVEVSRHAIQPDEDPGREMVLTTMIDIISSNNPEYDGIEETVYAFLDHVNATGVHSGYTKAPLNSGETIWLEFEGTHKLVTNGDNWELPYHGVFRYISGTGKYKAIRGGGTYDGFVNENGKSETIQCSAEY